MYYIPHILCILKTLIPTPSPARALVVAIDRDRKTSSHPDSPGIMSAFTVSSATAVRAPVRVAARRTAGAKIARGSVLARYTVTLETPEGAQAIECADDTYILDAAEVRATRRLARDSTRDARTRETNFFCVCIHRAVHGFGGPSPRRARNAFESLAGSIAIAIDIHPSSRESFRFTRIPWTRARA